MENKLVSVVVPVYNAQKTIKRCLMSILNSTYKQLEIIVIDDASIDESFKICQTLSQKFSNIKLFHNEKNKGVSLSRNIGIKNSHGFYIMFVDSDDWLETCHIELLVYEMSRYHNQILPITGYINDDRHFNGLLTEKMFGTDSRVYFIQNDILELYDQTLLQPLWNKIFLNEIIKKNHLVFNEKISIGEDTQFILEYLLYAHFQKFSAINQCSYHYMRDQNDSLMYNVGYEKIDYLVNNLFLLYQLTSLSDKQKKIEIKKRKEKLIENQAYLIFHNAKMSLREKKRLILNLDNGKNLYKQNKKIYYKERIIILLRKIWKRKLVLLFLFIMFHYI
ncbi:MAG: glycosyltransferase family 2 protein [Massilimicrobiota timonensis]